MLLLLFSATLTYGNGSIGSPTPPPPPQVPPIISGSYAEDLNGNRINDSLEPAPGQLSIASDERVEVELVFSAPITQQQIDQFLQLGGRITYIYQAISYGWNGSISRQSISLLPAALGPMLAQVEPAYQVQYYMDTATQTGRVRPIWQAGFAGLANGVRGDPNTTIALLGGGVDATHADLRGRCVYWKDVSDDNEPAPADYDGHETLVAGIAVGTGVAGGSNDSTLGYTYTYADATSPTWGHMMDPLCLPTRQVTLKSSAYWSGQTCILDQWYWTRGTDGATSTKEVGTYLRSKSPAVLINTYTPYPTDVVATILEDYDTHMPVENVTIITTVNPYPGVGDGFNKFSGVARGCNWAAVKVFDREGMATSTTMAQGLDELVKVSADKHIKIINISSGYRPGGIPGQSQAMRDKVNTIVNNGIIVVAAAGNGAASILELLRTMSDPARAAMALTVGATNDGNTLTEYSNYGFISPRTNLGEDYKPDLVAPGGSYYYTGMMSADSGTSDALGTDKEPNDYASGVGTSFSAPFVSGCAALVIDAMQKQGTQWTYGSSDQPRFVKMLLCATASETNAKRESGQFNPSLDRAAAGPQGFPVGKDQYEGYGLINPDAAVEAVSETYTLGATVTASLGGNAFAQRVWARTINLKSGFDIMVSMTTPAGADFDLYLYSMTPSTTGTPVILASSTSTKAGDAESLGYSPTADGPALLVVKRVTGSGAFTLHSNQASPPVATDVQATCTIGGAATITLAATDDGRPNPPGAMTYTILSLPAQGQLACTDGTSITAVPAKLPGGSNKVVYQAPAGYQGDDSFTFCADDGGTAPTGGQSNTATVKVTIVSSVTVDYQVSNGADDTNMLVGDEGQSVSDSYLGVGMHVAGLRFRNVKIPAGATITHATLKICANWAGLTAAVTATVRAEAADNPGVFAPDSHLITQVPTTSASKNWNWADTDPWTSNSWYESPDLSAVIQQVVSRPGWASGNALVLIYGPRYQTFGDERFFWSYEGASSKAAKLSITYQMK